MNKLALLLLVMVACKSKAKPAEDHHEPDVDTVPTPAAPAGIRLADEVTPQAYRVSLEVDPTKESFTGTIEIDVTIAKSIPGIWIHVGDVTIDKAEVVRGADTTALDLHKGTFDRVALTAAGEQPAGPATLRFAFTGKQDTDRTGGVRRREDKGDWYVITQLESEGARRVFPCFDEPRWKVPWTVTLTVPAGQQAFGNSPIEKQEDAPDGRHVVHFAPTKPLPSYLVAFAVGPFDIVDAGQSRTGIPIRIIVPRGRGADAAFAAKEFPRIQAALEDYTGSPYPYAKLDHLVIPSQPRGAMENAGLITYPPRYLLTDAKDGDAARALIVGIAAHELAHQWFGDLVTMSWWDDVWLNEAFATWASAKVVAQLYPELGGGLLFAGHRRTALDADGQGSARKIRQPVVTTEDIDAAFDGITYQKGATVIHMFETWVGDDVFQRGIRAYLAAHAWKHATAADFLAAIDEASDKDVAAAFSTFLDQAGAPVVEMEVDCPEGGAARMLLHQRRHLLLGATTGSGPKPRWQIPVCVRTSEDAAARCTMLAEDDGSLDLGPRCPRWVAPNAGGVGYYRAALSPPHDRALWSAPLEPAETVAAAVDLSIAVDAGEIDVGVLIDQLPAWGKSDHRVLRDLAAARLEQLQPIVEAGDRDAFRRLVADVLAPVAWSPSPRDSLAADGSRGKVATLLAVLGDGADETVELAKAWLDDHGILPPTVWPDLLAAAVRAKPDAVVDLLLAKATTAAEPDTLARRAILGALAQVEDLPRLQQVLALTLAENPITPERTTLLTGARTPEAQAAVLDFVKANLATLLAQLGDDWHSRLVITPCLADRQDEVTAWATKELAPRPEIGERFVTQAIEAMDQCIAIRGSLAPRLHAKLAP